MPKILLITTDLAPLKFTFPDNFQTLQTSLEQNIAAQIDDFKPEVVLIAPELIRKFLSAHNSVEYTASIVTKTRTGLKRVTLTEIQYFAADHKYVLAYYPHGELLLNESLNNLALEYATRVLRIHRNTLVNIAWIDELVNEHGKYYITIKGTKTRLSVSRRQLPAVRKYIKCGKLE